MGMGAEWRLQFMTKVGAVIMEMAVRSVKEKARSLERGLKADRWEFAGT
jgi:hypothetical protein